MNVQLTYGSKQQFRYRTRDINIIGRLTGACYPMEITHYSLNGGENTFFRVEDIPDPGLDWTFEYKNSPAVNRLKDLGDFNIEIPVTTPDLKEGDNCLIIDCKDAERKRVVAEVNFSWDPSPLPSELDLSDLTRFSSIQEVGQIVDGAFDLDRDLNLIRSRAPVYPDALLVVGSLYGSQEATYNVRFTNLKGVKWLGPSDFFVGHEGPSESMGIKPGWSTIGMANIDPRWVARAFISFGDHVGTNNEWVVQTCPPKRFISQADILYSVKHQVICDDDKTQVRYKVWPENEEEPEAWLCDENDSDIPKSKPRYKTGSFSLFQHSGYPIEWSNIKIRRI